MEVLLSRAGTIGGVVVEVWSCPVFSDNSPHSVPSDNSSPHHSLQRLRKMSAASNPENLSEIDSDNNSDGSSARSVPLSAAASERRRAAALARRNRARNRDANRDRRLAPKDIKLKTVPTHLQLTDPISQYGRWFFQLKQYLTTLDPRYITLFEGGDDANQL